jgi:hypothetical protein
MIVPCAGAPPEEGRQGLAYRSVRAVPGRQDGSQRESPALTLVNTQFQFLGKAGIVFQANFRWSGNLDCQKGVPSFVES